jgi:queuine/archaeosine tRNA-ribosyltransferase
MELHNLPYLFFNNSRAERKKSLHMVNHYNYSELILVDSNGFQFVRIGNQQNKFASKTKVQNRKSKSWQNAF